METPPLEQMAHRFRALGDPTRLRILAYLCECEGATIQESDGGVRLLQGSTAGEVCCYVAGAERINSTISAHLKELRLAGLIESERRGRYIVYRVKSEALEEISRYLEERVARNKKQAEGAQENRHECC